MACSITVRDLLGPLDGASFWAEHWGRAAVRVRHPRARLTTLLRVADVATMVAGDASAEHADLIRGGVAQALAPGAVDATGDEAAVEDRLLTWLAARRATLRVRRAQVLDAGLRGLALGLLDELEEEINVNVYLSPNEASPGLAPHRDLYGVFVLQVAGSKRWRLLGFEPAAQRPDAPLRDHGGTSCGTLGEVTLGEGEVLYVPQGVRHVVSTVGERASLHVTVGVLDRSRHSLVEWLATELSRTPGAGAPLGVPGEGRAVQAETHLAALAEATARILASPDRAARFAAHRCAVEAERTLADPSTHSRTEARGYR